MPSSQQQKQAESKSNLEPNGSHVRKLLTLAIPLIVSNIAIIGMEVIDTIMAGQASAEDLAGLAIGGNIWLILEVALGGLVSAITPRIARFYGAKQYNEVTKDTQQGMIFGTLFGVLSMLLMLSVVPFIPLLGASPDVTEIAQGYTQIIAFSLPISGICWALFCLMEAHGLMRFVVMSSLIAMGFNLVFDYIFVFGKFGFPALGGVGCAWTTTIIYWLWGASCIVYSVKQTQLKKYKIMAVWPKIDWQRWRAILALGLPIALALLAEEGFFNVSALLIAPLGTDSLGAHQITIQIVSLVLMIGLGLGQATAILTAQSIGRKQTIEMLTQIKTSFAMVFGIAFALGLSIFILRDSLPRLFSEDELVASISTVIMMFAPIYLVCDVLQIWAAQTLRGFEDTKIPMLIQITAYWLIGFPLGHSLGVTEFWGESYGVYGYWIGFLAGVFVGSSLLSLRLYLKSKKTVGVIKLKGLA